MLSLKNSYISVLESGRITYGGCQQRSDDNSIARCGCGIVAALDSLLYLSRYHRDCFVTEFSQLLSSSSIPEAEYNKALNELNKRYFPLIPRLGMNGLGLMCGMNLFFRRHSLPLKAQWGVTENRLWPCMTEMLSNDIPVILAIGPNFPLFWQGHNQALYTRSNDGCYVKTIETKAHYVTATGLDEDWIRISSWGQQLYLNRAEYRRFAAEHSTGVLSNILYIKRK